MSKIPRCKFGTFTFVVALFCDCCNPRDSRNVVPSSENLDFRKCDAQIRRTCTAAYSILPCDLRLPKVNNLQRPSQSSALKA